MATGEFKTTKEYQRLIFQERLIIDLIPFGPIADNMGKIKWTPDEQIVMHIVGFEEAFANFICLCRFMRADTC